MRTGEELQEEYQESGAKYKGRIFAKQLGEEVTLLLNLCCVYILKEDEGGGNTMLVREVEIRLKAAEKTSSEKRRSPKCNCRVVFAVDRRRQRGTREKERPSHF